MLFNNHGLLRENASLILFLQRLLDPTIAVLLLVCLADIYDITLRTPHIILAIATFWLILSIFKELGLYHPYRSLSPHLLGARLFIGWMSAVAILLFLGYLTKTSAIFSRSLLLSWLFCVPFSLLGIHLTAWKILRKLRSTGRNSRTAVIAGVNEISRNLANQILQSSELGIQVNGFFDSKSSVNFHHLPVLGTLDELPSYIRKHQVDVVYITCAESSDAAISNLVGELQDTTASVYFVPNLLISNLIHGRSYELNGIPLIAIWEVPFTEIQYILKRTIDIVMSALAIALLFPLMVVIAVAIKFSSPGPILFRQHRYGLNGEPIVIYKFRSMNVMQNGKNIPQAQRNDYRVTKVGALLRKTSLDELPQFINVLQGRMSIVGPRPHAVAHNEMYRKLIDGYMLRHKVKPGITGWAQVNGCRGETDTLEKMQQRVNYDLDYLKNWSLGLDLQIIFKTPFILLGGQNAY